MVESGDDFRSFFFDEYDVIVRTVRAVLAGAGDAEAITQDAFTKALVRWARVRELDRPGAWVRKVAVRDAVRASKKVTSPLADRPATVEWTDVDVWAEIDRLPRNQRVAVVLHDVHGWPARDVADVLGCAEATVRVHVHRGHATLAERLRASHRPALLKET